MNQLPGKTPGPIFNKTSGQALNQSPNRALKPALLALFCFILMFICTAKPALAADSEDENTSTVYMDVKYGQTEARTMLDMVNDFRTGSDAWVWDENNTTKTTYTNLKKLTYDYRLEKAAMQRAAEIALSFSHTRPNGTICWTVCDDYNYSYGYYAENIAAGYQTASEVFEGWQEADENYDGQGHRRNMLNSSVTSVGIGHVYFNGYHYWVQEFGDSSSGEAAVTANDSSTSTAVEVLLSEAKVSVKADPSSLTVPLTKSRNLPVINAAIQMENAWPSKASSITADYTWLLSDNEYASISKKQITGVKVGKTSLVTTVLQQSVSVPVMVLCEHTYDDGEVIKQADCTQAGEMLYTCTICGDTYREEISAPGHSYGKWITVQEATCEDTGAKERTCSVCGKKERKSIAAAGHQYTYTDNGNGTHTAVCKAGDSSYKESHTYAGDICSLCGSKKMLDTPKLSGVSNTLKGVTVKWKKVTGAELYRVYRKSGDSGWKKAADTSSASYTDKKAKSGTTYTYTVRCITKEGDKVSNYDKTGKSIRYLSAPKVSSAANKTSGITVKWEKVKGASGYYIYRKVKSGSWERIAEVKGGTTAAYTDKGVKSENGTVYVYTVRAYSGKTKSYYESGKTICRLTTPSISGLTNTATKKMTVKWKKDTKVTGYQIQYSTSSEFTDVKTVTVKKNSITSASISKLTKNKKYYVRIRKYKKVSDKNYYSAWSSVKSIKIAK